MKFKVGDKVRAIRDSRAPSVTQTIKIGEIYIIDNISEYYTDREYRGHAISFGQDYHAGCYFKSSDFELVDTFSRNLETLQEVLY